jgi:hypothetical protein
MFEKYVWAKTSLSFLDFDYLKAKGYTCKIINNRKTMV